MSPTHRILHVNVEEERPASPRERTRADAGMDAP